MEETNSTEQLQDAKEELTTLIEKVTDVLRNDVKRYVDVIDEEPDDVFWRRGFVRAVFAYIEGLTSTLKLKALITHKVLQWKLAHSPMTPSEVKSRGGLKAVAGIVGDMYRHLRDAEKGADFSFAEILLLLERSYRLNDKGQVKWTKAKIPLANNLQFAFQMYAKAAQINYSLPKGDAGWQNFRLAIKIRDRLTHPKRPRDLEVSQDEAEVVLKSFLWVHDCEIAFLKLIKEKVESPAV